MMKLRRSVSGRSWPGWSSSSVSRSQQVVLDRVQDLLQAGQYEDAEAEARAAAARRGRKSLMWVCLTKATALAAGIAHGRGAELEAELDALIAELDQAEGADRSLLLAVRAIRAVLHVDQGQYAQAEAEARHILRGANRLAHLTEVWDVELSALDSLAAALCGQGRYEEAEAIARGNISRAEGHRAAGFQCALVRSLNGQGRFEEALAETLQIKQDRPRSCSGSQDMVTATTLHGLGRRTEAEATARHALSACEQFLHPHHPRVQQARTLLARMTAEDPLL
ncbi:tetratricopeptide repeat protein [Streptomyces sp. NPDC058685]|uniref:tetratricopeptide repeat protein n=1 Tax=Streptomyces sp. NPDC058685 TaxID=3346598 RepID=UPI00364D2F58